MTDDGGVIRRLHPKVQPYAWGSTTALTELLDIPSTGGPMAELWLGDHPLLPSSVGPKSSGHDGSGDDCLPDDGSADNIALDEILRADPSTWFDAAALSRAQAGAQGVPGPACRLEKNPLAGLEAKRRSGPPDQISDPSGSSLRFLLKVLAIAEPLSLQTHPSKAQAEAGFAREDALGISRTAPNRNYRDANHKPELICALTEMDALSGFRPADETIALLTQVDDPAARFLINSLANGLDVTLRDSLSGLVFSGSQATASFAEAARLAAQRNPEHALSFGWWAALCDRHPGDGGIAVATLLHCVRLTPGQALFLGAGNMHAYLSGVAIEIMANSDNVLRGGLTPKHVDVDELLKVTNAVPGPLPFVMPVDISAQIFPESGQGASGASESRQWIGQEWPVPVDDFRLVRLMGQSSAPCRMEIATRPVIALCTQGDIRLHQGQDGISLGRGESAIAGNSDDPLSVSGSGTLFLASAG
jgi:mannose-6-phosphate isomerase